MHRQLFLGILVVVTFTSACETKVVTNDACGDGFLDPGEDCEPAELLVQTCETLGHYNTAGTLRCSETCRFDRTECGGRCGDLQVDTENEECDGGLSLGQTCEGLGYTGGTLVCGGGCMLDVTSCTSLCGNGHVEPDETCDDGDTDGDDGCSAFCRVEPGWSCEALDSGSVCTSICGDDVAVGGETCDGADLRGRDCRAAGFYSGQLACDDACGWEVSGCHGFCGDGEVTVSGGESCDGADLNRMTCLQLGYYRGELACADDCSFDVSACEGSCGDGLVEPENGEPCDPGAAVTATCAEHGFHSGVPGCHANCTWDLAGCSEFCGDGTRQAGFEACEGGDLGGLTCTDLGFYRGALACDTSCALDAGACAGTCGDAVAEALEGELCDGPDTLGVGCNDLDLPGGVLGCGASCDAYDTSACHKWVQIDAGGGNFACAVRSDGSLWCWGRGEIGQLGEGQTQHRGTPVPVVGMQTGVSGVSVGEGHACATKTDGSLWCWGYNPFGQLGDASTISRTTPVAVVGMAGGVSSVSLYYGHSCAIKTDGSLWCWGLNDQGQLGDGTLVNKSTPVCPMGMHAQVRSVAVGYSHSCAVKTDGTTWCWGRGTDGQLGHGAFTSSSLPVQVAGLTGLNPVAVFSGAHFNFVRLDTGHTRAWGYNSIYMLADGSIESRFSPVAQLGLDAGIVSLDASRHFVCARLPGDHLSCWGYNLYGVFGNGTTDSSTTPLDIPVGDEVLGVATGYSFSCILRRDGTIGCSGTNEWGQLGDGTTINRNTFANVIFP